MWNKHKHKHKKNKHIPFFLRLCLCLLRLIFTSGNWCEVSRSRSTRIQPIRMTLFQISSRARSIKMVGDRLAELVRSYPILYDKSLADFKNAYKNELAWNEIARKLSLKSGKQKHESNWVCLLDEWSLKWSKLYFCCIHILICSFWIPFLTMLTPFIVHNVLLHILGYLKDRYAAAHSVDSDICLK